MTCSMMDDINAVYDGQVGEQIAGQTLRAINTRRNDNLHYWYREQKGSTSEVDYLIPLDNRLVPVEVKSGKTGTLRSLHNFMDESGSEFAIRIYSGNLRTEGITTARGKKFTLFSILFYLLFRVHELLWALFSSRTWRIVFRQICIRQDRLFVGSDLRTCNGFILGVGVFLQSLILHFVKIQGLTCLL